MIGITKKASDVIEQVNANCGLYRNLKQVSVKRGQNIDLFQFELSKKGCGTTMIFKIPSKNTSYIYENFKNARCVCDGTKRYLIGLPYFKKLFLLDYSVFVIDYL